MYQPYGFQVPGKDNIVSILNKDLYLLNKSPKAWYIKIGIYLDENGFQHSPSYSNKYVKRIGIDITLLVIYVDEIIITISETHAI
jgi:hypothetical protein